MSQVTSQPLPGNIMHREWRKDLWNLLPANPKPCSPVQRALKFSAVLGTSSAAGNQQVLDGIHQGAHWRMRGRSDMLI